MADLLTDYGGITLKNPLVVASAGTTENMELIRRAEENGAAAVVMKTLFEEEYTRHNPAPCFRVIRRKVGVMSSSTFYSFEQASPLGPERYAEEIARARDAVEIPVIASINCVSDENWPRYAGMLDEAGADAIELNRSCPYSSIVMNIEDVWTKAAVETLKLVKDAVSIPVFPKLTPQLSNPLSAARALAEAGADGVVMFSRFTGLEIDTETEKPVMHGGFAGHGGSWSIHYALRWIAAAFPKLNIPVSASGGVFSGDDVIKYILAGAGNVQICTSLYMEGFGVIKNYLQRLNEFMEKKEYNSLADFRGKVCTRVIPTEAVDRSQRAVAYTDGERCSRCGRCATVCLKGAVRVYGKNDGDGEVYEIDENTCTGCGLCIQLCPRQAIGLKPKESRGRF